MARTTSKSGPRDRILETAQDLFYRQGYLATGINQIIDEAGVAKASFYQHFPSKEDLCLAYLEERSARWTEDLRRSMSRPRLPLNRVLAVFDFLKAWLPECGYRGCAFLNIASEVTDGNHAIRSAVVRSKTDLQETFRRHLTELQDSEQRYHHLSVAPLAEILLLLVDGAIVTAQTFRATWPVDAARRSFVALLDAR